MMFRTLPFEQRFDAAKSLGFDGVEIQLLAEAPVADIRRAAREAGIEVALINVDMGDLPTGGAGLSGVPGREPLFRRKFAEACEAATDLDAATLHLAPSRIPSSMDRSDCWLTYICNIEYAVRYAHGAAFQLVIEPVNPLDMPDALLTDIQEASDLAEQFDIGLLFDAYHVARLGLDTATCFEIYRKYVKHVQLSDTPGRRPPGSGTIPFASFFSTLRTAGYVGWAGAEYYSDVPDEADSTWLADARREAAAGPKHA